MLHLSINQHDVLYQKTEVTYFTAPLWEPQISHGVHVDVMTGRVSSAVTRAPCSYVIRFHSHGVSTNIYEIELNKPSLCQNISMFSWPFIWLDLKMSNASIFIVYA